MPFRHCADSDRGTPAVLREVASLRTAGVSVSESAQWRNGTKHLKPNSLIIFRFPGFRYKYFCFGQKITSYCLGTGI